MNYAQMSDDEINLEVLMLVEPDVKHMSLSADEKSFFHCGYDGNGFYETAIPDYCNSWTDAGPIIERERITITSALRRDWWDAIDISAGIEVRHVNPLRAAMIVFLMMQGKPDAA